MNGRLAATTGIASQQIVTITVAMPPLTANRRSARWDVASSTLAGTNR